MNTHLFVHWLTCFAFRIYSFLWALELQTFCNFENCTIKNCMGQLDYYIVWKLSFMITKIQYFQFKLIIQMNTIISTFKSYINHNPSPLTFTCLKSTTATPEQCVKVNNNDIGTTSRHSGINIAKFEQISLFSFFRCWLQTSKCHLRVRLYITSLKSTKKKVSPT